VQASSGNTLEVMPISPLNAPAVWCAMVATLAFQPKRPGIIRPEGASQTWLMTPLIGPSSGLFARIGHDVRRVDGFQQADADDLRRDARADQQVSAIGP
jgi:hypothetical protein